MNRDRRHAVTILALFFLFLAGVKTLHSQTRDDLITRLGVPKISAQNLDKGDTFMIDGIKVIVSYEKTGEPSQAFIMSADASMDDLISSRILPPMNGEKFNALMERLIPLIERGRSLKASFDGRPCTPEACRRLGSIAYEKVTIYRLTINDDVELGIVTWKR